MRTLGHRPNDIPIVLSPTLHIFLSFFSTILPNFSATTTPLVGKDHSSITTLSSSIGPLSL
jgi:hypothetical protein